MNDYLNREVSIFPCKESMNPRKGTLADFLIMCTENKDKIARIRSEKDKNELNKLKSKLPCCTISGLFREGHKVENLLKTSGLICIDIDHCDTYKVLEKLRQLNIVLYASRSASGKGVFAIIPLAYPEKHREQFCALSLMFKKMGMPLDEAPKSIASLRFMSYDDDAFLRPDPVEFKGILTDSREGKTSQENWKGILVDEMKCHLKLVDEGSPEFKATFELAEKCVDEIESAHINLCPTYEEWMRIAFSLSTLGERGRDLFRRTAEQHSGANRANPEANNRMYDQAMKSNRNINIATFFYECRQHGIDVMELSRIKENQELLEEIERQEKEESL